MIVVLQSLVPREVSKGRPRTAALCLLRESMISSQFTGRQKLSSSFCQVLTGCNEGSYRTTCPRLSLRVEFSPSFQSQAQSFQGDTWSTNTAAFGHRHIIPVRGRHQAVREDGRDGRSSFGAIGRLSVHDCGNHGVARMLAGVLQLFAQLLPFTHVVDGSCLEGDDLLHALVAPSKDLAWGKSESPCTYQSTKLQHFCGKCDMSNTGENNLRRSGCGSS